MDQDRAILSNAASLAGTTAVTSVLGFAYWWVAIRLFPAEAVGFGSAAISAMMLLGSIGVLGLGTILMGELPKLPQAAAQLIGTAVMVASCVSLVLGAAFAVAAPVISDEFEPLAGGVPAVGLFSLGVALTAATFVLDQALIGLLRGGQQLWRNTLFAISKLAFLGAIGLFIARPDGMVIYATWLLGNVISFVVPAAYSAKRFARLDAFVPDLSFFRGLFRPALGHHALNLALQAPGLLLPILVTAVLTARVNASFYAAWMIAGFAFAVPYSLTTVLFPVTSAEPAILSSKLRLTLAISFLSAVLSSIVIAVGAELLLSIFGRSYADLADGCLRILGLAVFPATVRYHYVAICRVRKTVGRAVRAMAIGGVLELTFATVGALNWGLDGLAMGWALAVFSQAAAMLPLVFGAATGRLDRARGISGVV